MEKNQKQAYEKPTITKLTREEAEEKLKKADKARN